MGLLSSLSREQKESIGLLQIGSFLEYFDLMLYVHMAVLLNEIFFPKTDPHTASLLGAFALCSSLAFRPIGALIFGWIGDHIGRRSTIIITTSMMAVSCIVMANLPTYAQIGISASWIVTICRILQGMSSMGEIIGAEIYLTESIQRPARFPAVLSLHIADSLGTLGALGVAFLVLSFGVNWRIAFWVGAVIAIVGAFARTRLRETPEFIALQKKQLREGIKQLNLECDPIRGAEVNATWKEPINYKTLMSYFVISSGHPLMFYLAFFHFIPLLKESFHYTPEDIITHNFYLSILMLVVSTFLTTLTCWIHPLRIHKTRTRLTILLVMLLPFLINELTSPLHLFLIQSLIIIFAIEDAPSTPVFWSHFPLYCRVTCATLLFSIVRALMYVIMSFGMVYIVSYLGNFGIWVIAIPIGLGSLYGLLHFERLERACNLYPNLSHKTSSRAPRERSERQVPKDILMVAKRSS